jgi:hypothetical protein
MNIFILDFEIAKADFTLNSFIMFRVVFNNKHVDLLVEFY